MRPIVLALIALAFAGVANADARYVAAKGGTPIIAGPGTIYTTEGHLSYGSRVDVREVYEGYALILLPTGVEAWVNDSVLKVRLPQPIAETPQAKMPNITPVEAAYPSVVWTKSGRLNMRSGPGFQFAVLDKCKKGDWLEVTAHAGQWSKVRLADGAEGWVASQFLTR